MNPIVMIDLMILGKCQDLSDWTTKTFGVGRAHIKYAWLLLSCAVLSWLLPPLLAWKWTPDYVTSFVCGIYFGSRYLRDFYLPNADRPESDVRQNPARYFVFRMFWSVWVVLDFVSILIPEWSIFGTAKSDDVLMYSLSFGNLFLLLFMYFISCSGLPPQKGRVRAWIEEHVPSLAQPEVAPGQA